MRLGKIEKYICYFPSCPVSFAVAYCTAFRSGLEKEFLLAGLVDDLISKPAVKIRPALFELFHFLDIVLQTRDHFIGLFP